MKIIQLELESPYSEGLVNAFLAVDKTITLIDTGNPGEKFFQNLKTQLKKHGLEIKDIDQILLTHIHPDHSGGVSLIQEESDIPVFVHEKAYSYVFGGIKEFEREDAFFTDFLKECGAGSYLQDLKRTYQEVQWKNINFLKDGDVLPMGGENFEVVHVPGHSQTDILAWNPKTGEAFIGDHLLQLFSVNAFIEPPLRGERERQKPLLQYRNSLKRINKMPLTTIYPGHGAAYTGQGLLIDKRLSEQDKRCSQIYKMLLEEEKTTLEISREMYPRLTGSSIFLGLSQVQGHIDLLESRRQVRSKRCGEAVKYYAVCEEEEKCL